MFISSLSYFKATVVKLMNTRIKPTIKNKRRLLLANVFMGKETISR